MKFKLNNKYLRWGVTAFLVIAASIAFYYFMFHGAKIKEGIKTVMDILMPAVLGLVTAYLLTPVLNIVEGKVLIPLFSKFKIMKEKSKKRFIRSLGILITAFLFVALIYILIYMLISQIVPSVESIIVNFDSYSNNFIKWLNQILEDNPGLGSYVTQTFDQYSEQLGNWLEQIVPNTLALIKTVSISVINVLGFLWDFVIGFIISIYVLSSKEIFAGQAKKIAYAFFERDTANIIIRNFRFTHKTFIGFLGGKIIDSIIIGIICFVGTSIMQMPYAALVSVIVGVTNVIPFFGPFLGAIPCTILIFVVDPMHPLNCVYFALFILLLQQFDGNILGPKILGNATGLSGFWVIFSITFFGGLFGIVGMVAGVPIFSVIYAGVKSIVNAKLEKRELSNDALQYQTLDFIDENGVSRMLQTSEVKAYSHNKNGKINKLLMFIKRGQKQESSENGNKGSHTTSNTEKKDDKK